MKSFFAKIGKFFKTLHMKNKKMRKSRGYRIFKKIMIGVLSALITSGILGCCCFVWLCYNYVDLDLDNDFEALTLDYSTAIYAYDSNGAPIQIEELYATDNRVWVTYEKIPDHVKNAVIAIEDKRFYSHKGVDWIRFSQAAFNFLTKGDSSYGGSTITQQLIKNITGDKDRSWTRKAKEVLRALYIERKYDKDQILEYYLNTVTFGVRCDGIETAVNYYFDKSVSDLTLAEAASVVGITNNPSLYDPFTNRERNHKRARTILGQMLNETKVITQDEYDAAITELENMEYSEKNREKRKDTSYSYFVDTVISDVIDDLVAQKGYTQEYASTYIYTKGLKIYTTMDPDVQSSIDEIYKDRANFPGIISTKGEQTQSAIVIMDPKTGDVLGLAGGVGEKTDKRGLNRATQGIRQPGSSIKPIAVYAPAMENGIINSGSIIDDTPVLFDKEGSENGLWPKNNDGLYQGLIDLRQAIITSSNCAAVRVMQSLGVSESFDFLTSKLGITTLVKNEKRSNGLVYSDLTDSLALGGVTDGISPLEMTAAYQIFPSGGLYNEPRTYTHVESHDGKMILQNNIETSVAISAQTAYCITQFLEDNNEEGTGVRASLGESIASAGKTGTTSDDKDRWYVGFTPEYVAGIWVGFDTPEILANVIYSPCTPLFSQVLSKVYQKKGIYESQFTIPGGVVEMEYCKDSGLIPTDICRHDARDTRAFTAYFDVNNMPDTACDRHFWVYLCSETSRLATEKCKANCAVYKISLYDYVRVFPKAVTVLDARFLMPRISESQELFLDPLLPAYRNTIEEGQWPAVPSAALPPICNALCDKHNKGGETILPVKE